MRRCAALVVLLFLFGVAFAQGQTSPPAQPGSTAGADASSTPSVGGHQAGSIVTVPRVTYSPDPKYPKQARKAHKEGVVVLSVVVGGDGRTRDIKVVRGLSPELDEAAMDAVKEWKFAPAMKEGNPVAVQIKIEINFRL
jgi:TonB family protein